MVLTLSRQFVTLTGTGKAVRVFFCLLYGIFYFVSLPLGSVSRLFNIVSIADEVASNSNRTYFVIREEQILIP